MAATTFRSTLLLFTICITSVVYGQGFRIQTDCVDTLSNGSFHFSVGGSAEFTDSMIVTVEIFSNDSLQTVVFSGTKDFTDETNSTLADFTIDSVNNLFTVSLTDLPSTQYFVFIRSRIAGEMKEEVLIPAFITL
jgi:uncharacterized protein YhdP